MVGNEQSNEMLDVEAMISPSAQTIQETYESLERLIAEINEDSRAVDDTLKLASDILNALGSSADLHGSWLNPITLPIPAAMKAVSAAVSRYVEQRTGFSVRNWAEFADSSRAEIEAYLIQLQQVAELAQRSYGSSSGPSAIAAQQLRGDRDLLEETKRKTALWEPVIARLTKLHELARSMLEAAEKEQEQEESVKPDRSGWLKKVDDARRVIGDAVDGVRDRYHDQLDKLMTPLRDLRNRAIQLQGQVIKLEQSVSRLRYLLDLEVAQIRAALGEIPEEESENLSRRIAVHIIVPQLKERLSGARSEARAYQTYLERLHRRHEDGEVGDEVYDSLATEYQSNLQAATSEVSALERQADIWKKHGMAILSRGRQWLEREIEMIAIREAIGEIDQATAERKQTNLARELERFEGTQRLIQSL